MSISRVGVSSVQIAVAIAGDTVGEGNETFNLALVNPVGNIAITDGSATGTILNNDPIALTIMEIQGEAHRSAYDGQPVITTGIVTAVASNGFYLQDPAGDGNSRTSDAIFVFTGSAPTVAVGDAVQVSGKRRRVPRPAPMRPASPPPRSPRRRSTIDSPRQRAARRRS